MLRLIAMAGLLILALMCTGCRNKIGNQPGMTAPGPWSGGIAGGDSDGPRVIPMEVEHLRIKSVTITPSSDLDLGDEGTLVIDWEGESPPVQVHIDIEPIPYRIEHILTDLVCSSETSPFQCSIAARPFGVYRWEVRLIDQQSRVVRAEGQFAVWPEPGTNLPPQIIDVSYYPGPGLLKVEVADPDNDWVTVEVSSVPGMYPTVDSYDVFDGAGEALFHWYSEDITSDVHETVTITASDYWHRDEPVTTELQLDFYGTLLPESTLAAVPMQTEASVGEEVTVVVATGEFPSSSRLA